MAPRALIVYGTSYGQTAKVAARIGQVLKGRGFAVTLTDGDVLPPHLRVRDFDAVVVGASMIMRGYQKCIRAFVRGHSTELNALPSAFFAVSGAAASADPKERAEAQRLAEAFCADNGWKPAITEPVAGAIAYTKYNLVLRLVMRWISRKERGATDMTRDHAYTDWAQVERFAERCADLVVQAPETVGAPMVPEPALAGGAQ